MSKSIENSITVRDLLKIVNFRGEIEFFEKDSFGQPWYLTKDEALNSIVLSVQSYNSYTLLVEVKEVEIA